MLQLCRRCPFKRSISFSRLQPYGVFHKRFSSSGAATKALDLQDTILQRLQYWARKDPLAPAVTTKDETHEKHCSYKDIVSQINYVSGCIKEQEEKGDQQKQLVIAFLASRNSSFVAFQMGIWASGGIAVPIFPHHPVDEMQYVLNDAMVDIVLLEKSGENERLVDAAKESKSALLEIPFDNDLSNAAATGSSSTITSHRTSASNENAQILYTSGTTSRPKGVLMTHSNLRAQVQALQNAWKLNSNDHLLHFLPLHHTHGILCKLLAPLYSGGHVTILPNATPTALWKALAETSSLTLFMAVPTVYMKMLEAFPSVDSRIQNAAINTIKRLRVCICGSMACPERLVRDWEALTTQRLLERYGMTELGMALTNPLRTSERHVGYVGQPFPSIEARIVDPETESESLTGELRVKGPNVFAKYWNRPASVTRNEFDADGWFKTGDCATYDLKLKSYKILGRLSVDVLKTGGYKVSALEIEARVLDKYETHPIAEVYVVGIPDETWGEIIGMVVRLKQDYVDHFNEEQEVEKQLIEFSKQHLADYKVPRRIRIVSEIPKNALGKYSEMQ